MLTLKKKWARISCNLKNFDVDSALVEDEARKKEKGEWEDRPSSPTFCSYL